MVCEQKGSFLADPVDPLANVTTTSSSIWLFKINHVFLKYLLSNTYTANINSIDVFPVLFLFKGSYRVKLALISQFRTITTERLETVSSCDVMSESALSEHHFPAAP